MTETRSAEEVWVGVRELVAEMVEHAGVELEEIEPGTMLGADLGLSSVDTIYVMMSLEERFGDELDLEGLMVRDGEYRTDLSMRELHEFLCAQLEVGERAG